MLDPEKRLTAKQCLSHPFLSEYHDPESEPDSDLYDDSFESLELDVGEWKSEYRSTKSSSLQRKPKSHKTTITAVFFFLLQSGLIHMEIMTFDPKNPCKTAV